MERGLLYMPAASVMFQGRPLSVCLSVYTGLLYRILQFPSSLQALLRLLFLPMQESPACSGDDEEKRYGWLRLIINGGYGASERACTGVTARKNPCRRKVAAVKIFTSSPASQLITITTLFDKRLGGPTTADDGAQEEDGRR